MACPYLNGDDGNGDATRKFSPPSEMCSKVVAAVTEYAEYLELSKLLDCHHPRSAVHDEHLFITMHQTYELWFAQIIVDIDDVCKLFDCDTVDETKAWRIVGVLDRTTRILQLLVEQILLLDTMSPMDFLDFRTHLGNGSGFQSLQFRIIENKLGVCVDRRIKCNGQPYSACFCASDEVQRVRDSENGPSLLQFVDRWLSHLPGLEDKNGNLGFWTKYVQSVKQFLDDAKSAAEALTGSEKEQAIAGCEKNKQSFNTILDPSEHAAQMRTGNRCLSHDAIRGAMMVFSCRDMPGFALPYQMLSSFMEIDKMLMRWRFNHVTIAQQQIGSKQGTSGTSGYMYLKTTMSDRYKIFPELCNLSTWLIPRSYQSVASK